MSEQCAGEPERAPKAGDRSTFHVPYSMPVGLVMVVTEHEARGWRLIGITSAPMANAPGKRLATVTMEYAP